MSLERLAGWLRCPNCSEPLSPTAALTIGCASGHRFDVNKRGYVTLVNTRSATSGDTPAMLNDRAQLLESGAYAPILEALTRLLPPADAPRVLDAGCGTGYYLRHVLAARTGAQGLAMDRSAAAVRIATRTDDAIRGLVADTWEPLPVRDGICDVVLNVFSPRNPNEFARVIARDGALLVVVPHPDHLHELRAATGMLAVPAGKTQHVAEQLAENFTQSGHVPVRFTLTLGPGQAELLREMGPSAHHHSAGHGAEHGGAEHEAMPKATPSEVTVAADVLRFGRR